MKGRFFWIALIIIAISWAGNALYAYSKQLVEPIFLEHYVETIIDHNTPLTLYYLTNQYDPSTISHVNLGGITGYITNDFSSYFNDEANLQQFNRYGLRSIQVTLDYYDVETMLSDEPITTNEIEVFFNDGQSMTAAIGEITILESRPENDVIHSISSSGSNSGRSMGAYKIEESVTIEQFSNRFSDLLGDQVLMTVDTTRKDLPLDKMPGTDIRDIEFPYEINEDENFNIYTQISPEFIGYLYTSIIFSGITSSGKNFTAYHPLYSQQPYLTQKDVNRLIKERGRFQ